jgi:3-oxoacyl-[acyl-carrier protein] reductase
MDLGLSGRVAIVGGASRGLGRACAERLAREGANLVIVARGEEELEAAAEAIAEETGVEVLPVVADQSRPDAARSVVDRAMERFGRIDVLVNNTGGPPPGAFVDHDDAAWRAAFDGTLMSVVRFCRAVVPIMREQRWGRIVNDTSFTVKEPAERLILSNVFRVGVVALSKTLAREVAGDGITVNCVCPGAFDTDRLRAIFREQSEASGRDFDDVRREWEARIPIGRLQRPEELADLVAFLASDRAAAITGACLPVDGGMTRGLF